MNDFMPDLYTFLERHFGLSVKLHDLDGEEMSIDLSAVSEQAIIGLLATEYKPAVLRRLRLEQMKRNFDRPHFAPAVVASLRGRQPDSVTLAEIDRAAEQIEFWDESNVLYFD
jgi:hypothetical protein